MFSPDKRKKTLDYTKVALDSSGKMTSQLFDLNMYDGETLSMRKRKNIVQRLSSFLIAAIVLYWIISDTCSQLSVFQLQLGRGWSSLLQLLGFTVFVCAVTAMIAVGAPFSRLQRTMLMFWAILMLIRSAMSRTALYVSILGILLTGWHGLVEKTATT
ncbi:uncharacterized protein LOC109794920 [Cajanus cajan]|uniref:uncharacterized protein LOC109794920 n=1 Tax=Cajanus cajan TaxID=3821 RepID=UPI00098D9113|nr:uncharacterized protein LOC109794920 [Cajanus cajan]